MREHRHVFEKKLEREREAGHLSLSHYFFLTPYETPEGSSCADNVVRRRNEDLRTKIPETSFSKLAAARHQLECTLCTQGVARETDR